MTVDSLAKWIEELDRAHEKLEKRVDKIVAGGGFDPSAYVYATPFIDASENPTNIIYYIPTDPGDEGVKQRTHTAVADSVVIVTLDASTSPDTSSIILEDGTDNTTLFTASDGELHIFIICLKAGQTIKVVHSDTNNARAGLTVFRIYAAQHAQLQEAPVGLLGRIAKTVKKAIKGR